MKLKKILKNNILQYVFSRYLTYAIQFVNSLTIAVALGPFYLGIWGFVNLLIQYVSQANFGIPSAVNILGSKNKEKESYVQGVFSSGFLLSISLVLISFIIIAVGYIFNLPIGNKYHFRKYLLPFSIIVGCNFLIPLLSNVLRIEGNIREIAVSQTVLPASMLIVSIFFRGETLLWALLWSNVFSALVTLLLFSRVCRFKISWTLNRSIFRLLLSTGFYLFIYNTSFYFITYTTRSVVSHFYSVIEFGYFTFAFTLGNTVNMLLSSLSFLIFPKLINRFAKFSDQEGYVLLAKLRMSYITTSHLLIHVLVFVFPIMLIFLPQYGETLTAFRLIALTVVFYANSFGYQGLLLAKGKQKLIALLSTSALVLNIIFAVFLAKEGVSYSYVILATMLCYFCYVLSLSFFGRKIINLNTGFFQVLKDVFPLSQFGPYLISVILSIFEVHSAWFALPLMLFIALNAHHFKEIRKTVASIIRNPKIVNI